MFKVDTRELLRCSVITGGLSEWTALTLPNINLRQFIHTCLFNNHNLYMLYMREAKTKMERGNKKTYFD